MDELEIYNRAYKDGYKDAIRNYAICKDGKQYIGVMQRPLEEVLEEVEQSKVPIRYLGW